MKLFVKYFSVLLIGTSLNVAVNAETITIPCDSSNKKNECITDCPTTCANEATPCPEKTPCCPATQMKNDATSTDDVAPTSLNSQNSTLCTVVKKVAPLCFAIGFLLAYHKLCQSDAKADTKTDAKADTKTDAKAEKSTCYSKTMDDIIKAIVAVCATDVIKDFLKEVKKTGTDFIAENTSFAC